MRPDPSSLKSLVALIGILVAQPLLGQTAPRPANVAGIDVRPLHFLPPGDDAVTSANPWSVQQLVGRKSPVLAGVLSFGLPGVGSFYAGNSSHGTRHVLIAGVAIALGVAGAVLWTEEVVEDCLFQAGNCDSSNGGVPLLAVGYGLYLGNMFWATGVAIGDANAQNRAIAAGTGSAQLKGGVSVQPTLRLSSPVGLTAGGTLRHEPRLGLRFVRPF